ncbi:MAG TPA: S8 family serine peptidase [Acidimicrobiales bacterium]|nr:S8 family serine peptidase [Acidimicrobiales bacterium]
MHTLALPRRVVVALALAMSLAAATVLPGSTGAGADAPARAAAAAVDDALRTLRDATARIIVQKHAGTAGDPERTVHDLGGQVTRDLPLVNGFSATVPTDAVPALADDPSVRAISLDRRMQPQGESSSGVKSVFAKVVGSDDMDQAGHRGAGVTVALIDTGVADVPDLAGRVLPVTDDITGAVSACQNLSGEAGCADSYGHGTFIAGLIAGNGASSGGRWKGAAPEANLVSVKIAGRDGSADVSGVIAGIQWVVSFKDRYNIRVLNLSLGTDSTQSYKVDPLNYAVERAWDAGIVVVVSASNRGPAAGTIAKPGDDPLVVTVGATDDRGTPGLGDDLVPDFTSRGPTAADGLAKPDVTAPGAHVVSLRAPGSEVDTRFPNYVDGAYRQGSGTSMAAGVVSGVVASMLSAQPAMTPDRAKYALMSTARRAASDDANTVGAGTVDAYEAAFSAPAGVANVGVVRSSGLGSLDASRGTVRIQAGDPLRTVVEGTLTAQLLLWDPVAFTGSSWYGSSWYGSSWYGSSWYGSSWYGSSWYGSSWYGSSWYGSSWYGSSWYGSSWYGSSWYGSSWYGGWE